MSHLSDHFKQRRLEKALSLADLAKRVGYRTVSRGIRRIDTFERTGHANAELIAKIAKALELDEATVTRLAYEDWCDWFATMNKPAEPYLLRRILFGGGILKVPENRRSVQAAEEFASDFANRNGTEVCLVLSRRMRVWFAKDGSLMEVIEETPGGQ